MTMMTTPTATPDFAAIKAKQNAAWSSGDYRKIGVTLQITGEELAEAADLSPGSTVLDIAAGNGNATLAFARRWCDVTSTDYVESLLDGGRRRAEAEGLDVAFRIADAEDLPFEDARFDAVVSSFGIMFAPDQNRAATEMMRVCRSGGTIAMANWTPDSFIGALFRTLGRYVPPPEGVKSPARWGDTTWIQETFAPRTRSITTKVKPFHFRYPSPQFFVDYFRTFYGPVHKAFLTLDEKMEQSLNDDILATIAQFDVAEDGTMSIASDYAETVMVKA